MGLACLGWAFVNIVTLRRTDPFTSGNGGHAAFKKLLWMVPIVFLTSTINTQRQPHDLAGYCGDPSANGVSFLDQRPHKTVEHTTKSVTFINEGVKESQEQSGVIFLDKHNLLGERHVEIDNTLKGLFKSIAANKYLEEFEFGASPTCKVYSWAEVFKYNMLFWNIAFMMGLNFTHLDKGPLKEVTLDWQIMKTWGKGMWVIFFFEMILAASVLFILSHVYIEVGIFKYYVIWGSALVSFMVWNTHRNKEEGRELHVHHYVVALILMSFNSFQSPYASCVHAFCHGFFIEGGCRWGFDQIWEFSDDSVVLQRKKILLNHKQSEARKANHETRGDSEVHGVTVAGYPSDKVPVYGSFVVPPAQVSLPPELTSLLTPMKQ